MYGRYSWPTPCRFPCARELVPGTGLIPPSPDFHQTLKYGLTQDNTIRYRTVSDTVLNRSGDFNYANARLELGPCRADDAVDLIVEVALSCEPGLPSSDQFQAFSSSNF